MKNAQFNVNEKVTVQLTDHGVDILRHNHYEYQNYLKSKDPQHEVLEFVPPENNMYTDQMWHFMKIFGEYMGWGRENPFVLTITIHNIDSQESQQLKAENNRLTEYEKELEAENAAFNMRLEEAYNDIGRYKRKLENAIVIVEQSKMGDRVKRLVLKELRGALGD